MPNHMIYKTRISWRIVLAALTIGSIPTSLWSQEALLPQRDSATATAPFTGYDDSLTKAADTLLASAPQRTTGASGSTIVREISNEAHPMHHEIPARLWRGGSSIAAARLDWILPAIDPILQSRGVPLDLAAVVLVESGGRADALSPKGARGLWQLMPDTARRYGLRVDDMQDDRIDLFRATDAAAQYLRDLYLRFGDWKLALAAYNTGEANVGNAITKAHTQDFDQLVRLRLLPLETRNYVPRILAVAPSVERISAFGNSRHADSVTTVFAVTAIR